jgi:predicted regulator of Ras-like GTPase activity (Roadblock/LC7/MglB family)
VTVAVVETWVEAPLKRFVGDARVLLALLLYPSGQVLAQHGFTRAVDVMSACALAAAINASAGELGRQLEGRPFDGLHHAGKERQIFLAEARTDRGAFIFLTVFDHESSLGLVRLYFDEFRQALAAAAPPAPKPEPVLTEHFERDLNRNLAVLFGRA